MALPTAAARVAPATTAVWTPTALVVGAARLGEAIATGAAATTGVREATLSGVVTLSGVATKVVELAGVGFPPSPRSESETTEAATVGEAVIGESGDVVESVDARSGEALVLASATSARRISRAPSEVMERQARTSSRSKNPSPSVWGKKENVRNLPPTDDEEPIGAPSLGNLAIEKVLAR